MRRHTVKSGFLVVLFCFSSFSPLFAQAAGGDTEQALEYRRRGLEAQNISDLDHALMYYQKAVELDPKLYMVFNDIGIVYERKGDMINAEAAYKKALTIKQDYLNPYSNLACLYEQKSDFKTAAKYWQKRVSLGHPDDPWTKKAADRLAAIGRVDEEIGRDVLSRELERETSLLISDVRDLREKEQKDPSLKAQSYLKSASEKYDKGDYLNALNDALAAKQYDNNNAKTADLIESIQKKILIR